MKATYNATAKTKFNPSSRKEGKCYFEAYTAIVIGKNYNGEPEVNTPVEIRLYGTDSMWHCAIWVNGKDIHTSGTGSAGGGGYHKPSAAAAEAIRNAGIKLDKSISGVGETAIKEAVKAIAEMMGFKNCPVLRTHQ